MSDSHYFPVFSGLLTKEHRENIGPAIWEFLWCISATTKETEQDGNLLGIVLGGRPVSYSEVAKVIGSTKSTVKRNFERLEEHGYITMKRTPYGHIIHVTNSKKFKKSAKNGTGAEIGTGAKNEQRGAKNGTQSAKNGHSNKDIKDIKEDIKNVVDINNDPGFYERTIIQKYMQLAAIGGFDISEIEKIAVRQVRKDGVPLEKALELLEECFANYKPRHSRDKINSFNYCATYILNRYFNEKEGGNSGKEHSRSFGRAAKQSAKPEPIFGDVVGRLPRRTSVQ